MLTNEGTSFTLSTATSGDGTYIFTPLKIGNYAVVVEAPGFQKTSHPHIAVDVQQQVVVDFTLVPGAVTQTVEVIGAPPQLQTTNASVGQVADTRQINDLPLNGRNYTFLAQLAAGVTQEAPTGRGMEATGSERGSSAMIVPFSPGATSFLASAAVVQPQEGFTALM